ncbi:MAG TPA: hypothetical protein VLT58_05440 [Polyangia bacterium]|nr:hypothetical protein [Polyangia bacterium]
MSAMARTSRARCARFALASALLLAACSAAPQEKDRPDAAAPQTDGGSPPMDGGSPSADAGVACPRVSDPALAAPSTIADAVALANALLAQRSPVSLECFLAAVKHPLTVLGVVSTFSLQPSVAGALNPRVFIFSGNLVMSVVPAGDASPFVELAEYTSPVRSIKGQLEFPVTAPVALADAYDSIHAGIGTVCSGCHRDEQQATQVTAAAAFESGVLAPLPSDVVPVQKMQDDWTTCDPQTEPERCAILKAILSPGPVLTGSFSADAPTIFN